MSLDRTAEPLDTAERAPEKAEEPSPEASPAPSAERAESWRPPVRTLAAVSFLAGLLAILHGMSLFGVSRSARFALPVGDLAPLLAVAALVYAACCFSCAYGFGAREPWAWLFGAATQAAGLAILAVQYRPEAVIGLLASAALALEVLRELARPGAKEWLEGAP